jgi:hypothetical protein
MSVAKCIQSPSYLFSVCGLLHPFRSTVLLESRFDEPSNQRSELSASKQHWQTCLPGALLVALFVQRITWRFFPPLVCWNVLWPLQACESTRPRLELKWIACKSATFSRLGWFLPRHTKEGPGTIKSRLYNRSVYVTQGTLLGPT